MPNWTSNVIRAEGAEADLREFLEKVRGPTDEQLFDFNRLIPMPEMLRHTASGGRNFDGVSHSSWYVENPEAPFTDRIERPFTAEEAAALEVIGFGNWYCWSVAHWGTKWNACHAAVDDASLPYGGVELTFDTAWSEPEPIFHRMFAMFPKLRFTCEWRHEDESPYPHSLSSGQEAA